MSALKFTIAEKLAFKQKLVATGEAVLRQRIQFGIQSISEVQQAANAEEKSSAGDKYETGRAMSHLEKDMLSRQLQANQSELHAFSAVSATNIYDSVQPGSVVHCTTVVFFIAAGLGKILIDNSPVYFLSPAAPVTLQLLNKKPGHQFLFNNVTTVIAEVF
ncbi:MAG: hypothetical protein ABIO05_07415 [Ferruginibacter sp.]